MSFFLGGGAIVTRGLGHSMLWKGFVNWGPLGGGGLQIFQRTIRVSESDDETFL